MAKIPLKEKLAEEYADKAPEQDTWDQRYASFLAGYDTGECAGINAIETVLDLRCVKDILADLQKGADSWEGLLMSRRRCEEHIAALSKRFGQIET